MTPRIYALALGFLTVAACLVYATFRAVVWLKPSIVALAKIWGG